MKKIALFLIAMMAAVMPIRADYTLSFVESTTTSDGSTAYTMDVSKVFTDASNVVGEVTNVTSVYPAKKGYGAKFGSSKAAGNLKFTLLQSTYVAAILKVAAYTTTTSVTLNVNGMEFPLEMPADGSPMEVTYSPGASFESMEISSIGTTRFYLLSVTLVEQGSSGGGTSDNPCAIKSFPWEENFDAAPITADEVIPTCWDNSMGSQSMSQNQKWSYYNSSALSSQCVRFDSYNTQSGEWNTLKTPMMTLPQGMALFVKYKNPTGGDFNIYMYGADGAATILKSRLVDVANWTIEKIDLSTYAGQTVSFGFECISNYGNGDAYIYIDKVAVMSNTQELDTESDPDFGPQIIIEEYQTLRVELARIGRVEPGWYDVMVVNMKTLPTVTSMNPDLLRIDSVRFVDAAGEAVSDSTDAVSLRIHYSTTPTMLGYLEGTISIVAGQISATLPFAVNVTEVYELVPLNPEEALHLSVAPGEMLTFTLKFMHTGFTPDQVSAGFPYGVSTEGYELGQLYSLNDTVMALDVHVSGQKNGVYSTEVMLEAHAGVCFSDVTAYVRFETKISDSWIQKLTKEINFGVLPLNSGVYADTVYLKYHNVNLDSVVVGTNILSYEGEPYIPCGVGNTIILNDSILAVPVECNTNIVEVGPGSYSLRFYYVVYDDNVVTDEDTDIPVKMTFVAPEFRIAEELDFGTMLFDETKMMTLQFETRYCEISDIEISSSSEILTVGDVLEVTDSTAGTGQGAWKKYEVAVTLNAYEVGNLYQDLFCRFGGKESVVTVKAFIPRPTVTIMQEAYDFGKVPQNSGAYSAQILLTFSNALPNLIGYTIRNQNEADTSWVPVGFADRVLRDSTTLEVNMMLNSDGLAIGKYDWFFFVSYGKESYAIPVMANIVQASQIEIIPEVIDFGDVPFSSLVNDYISTEVKIATTSVHQAVASIEGDSAFSLSQFTFGPTESYFGNRLEQDLTIYALSDRMGQHTAQLKLDGDSGKTVAIAQVMMNVVPREVLYDTIRATICDNESYPFGGEMIWNEGMYSETTKTIYGGDSVTTLVLTVLPTLYGDVYATIRDYEEYVFQGDTIREAGDFRYPLSQAASTGCDSVVTLHLTVLATMYRTEEATICANQSYTFYDEVYSQAGQYEHRIENTQLGDSLITLNLTVLPTKTGEEFATIRDYEIYEYQGDSLSKAGDYTYTLVAANGCDSVVTLHLTVLSTTYVTLDETICANDSYVFYGQGLGVGDEGTYTHRIENTQSGDSVITLNLTVNPVYNFEDRVSISASQTYTWHGRVFTEAGVYADSLQSVYGCDSIWTLALTVLETRYDTTTLSICEGDSVFFGDRYLFTSGIYEESYTTAEGRDSLSVLILDVKNRTYGEQQQITIIEGESYLFGGRQLTEAGDYYDTIPNAAGCDSVLWVYVTVVPLCSEYVVVNEPEEVVYYDDEAVSAPVVSLVCPSRDAVIEWGVVRNYKPMSDGKVDVTSPVEYESMQVASMNEYQGDTLSSRFNYYVQDRTQYFYYLIWQCDEIQELHLFRYEHAHQVNSIWVNYAAPKREQTITSDATISVDGGEPQAVTIAWYNTQDAANVATGTFVHGQTYYAVVTTPMTEVLGENYHIDATTAIVWGGEQQPKALVDGQLQSPMYTMENVTWSFRLEDAQLAPDGQAWISACAEPSVSISGINSVVLNWELSTDNQNWLTLSDTLGYNIDYDSYCTDIHFPATLLRADTYYIRVRAQYGSDVFFSRTAELVIQAGIVMAEEATQQTVVTETGEEVATVQYMYDEEENVGVLTLTESHNEGSATTAVAITSNTIVEIVGTNTVVSDEAGFESSGDLEFVGRVDSTQVDEDGNTIYAALDSMSIVSRRPLYAPGQGVKVTFNGIYMTLTVYGHEDDNLVPSRSAARAQMKRAYSIAHAALEAAGDESVISGFDEADFINCGVIEPEGAEYDDEDLQLEDNGDPVYNCTIAPMEIPLDPMSTGMVKDEIRAEKRIVNDVIYIFRQNKTYTMMGQAVK